MSSLNAALANVHQQLNQPAAGAGTGRKPSTKSPPDDSSDDESEGGGGGGVGDISIDDAAPILVFCRIRPGRGSAASKQILAVDTDEKRVEFNIPKVVESGNVNNSRDSFKFQFNGLFDQQTNQEEMFNGVGKRVVDNVLAGFNGTVFAYGQTGSGKTWTIMGGTERYEDRGLIPRTLSYIFDWIAEHASEFSVTVRISYLEIYNDKGYDLLDPQHEHKSLEELPRVTLMESDAGAIHFRNLGELPAANVDEALNLLFVGDTNRVVCETPSNDSSTRSHCIFMISLEIREIGGGSKVRRSKLNLVDLAGSERIKKTGVGGKILNEALHINVSLHYLEQVIVALHEASHGKSTHIPYRNSMLTSVLRDSLGGNCKTVMIATLSPEKGHLDESISTSRFAQRVGMIKNHALLNEETDPYVMVKQLKGQMKDMRMEIAALRGLAKFKPLEEEEIQNLRTLISTFIQNDRAPQFDEDGTHTFTQLAMPNPYKVRTAFEIWKEYHQNRAGGGPSNGDQTVVNAELQRLQRENSMLIDVLRKSQANNGNIDQMIADIRARASSGSNLIPTSPSKSRSSTTAASQSLLDPRLNLPASPPALATAAAPPAPTPAELALAKLRAESFESFRRSYRKHAMVEEQKVTHAEKVEQARRLGEEINEIRNQINSTKQQIEAHRLARGVELLDQSNDATLAPDSTEIQLRTRIDDLKTSYRLKFESLKSLKAEVDYLKNMVQQSREKLQADFERWWQTQHPELSATNTNVVASPCSTSSSTAPPSSSSSMSGLRSSAATVVVNSVTPSSSSSSTGHPSQSRSTGVRPPVTEAWSTNTSATNLIQPSASIANSSISTASVAPSNRPSSRSSRSTTSSSSVTSSTLLPGGLTTTGNSAADADIQKFYEMKEQLMRQRQLQQQQPR